MSFIFKGATIIIFTRKPKYNPNMAPSHVAMIMDGNGRWAKRRGLSRSIGHRYGVENLKKIVEASLKFKVKNITVYAFSTENWKRPKDEIDTLFDLIKTFFEKYSNEFNDLGVRVKIIGTKTNIPPSILEIFNKAEDLTKNNQELTLYFAFNYGFSEELVQCIKTIALKHKNEGLKLQDIDYTLIENNLYTKGAPMVDLLIRTSGEMRISNFLMYQISYAELYFTKTFWPDFNESAYLKALITYQKRNRRFGGL